MDKERRYRNLFAQCQRSGSTCDQILATTLVLPGTRVRKYVVERQFQRHLKENEMLSDGKMVAMFKCHNSHPKFPATEPLSFGQMRKRGRNHHFQGAFDVKKRLIKTILVSSFLCICKRICHWYETEKSGTYTENSGRRRAHRCRTRAVDINYA